MDANWQKYCRDVMKTWSADGVEEKKEENGEISLRVQIAVYKSVVTGDEKEAWNALKHLGRPKWNSIFPYWSNGNWPPPPNVVNLAANKLMMGLNPQVGHYNENTMFGVASMLCRVGVRPHSTSALASRAIADFMAILGYVNYEKDAYLSSYAFDPVLTLGAMKVWYALENGLAEFILPQLKKLILDDAMDTGGIGEMVARILLLLWMDKCAIGDVDFHKCSITGEFVPVEEFLGVLKVTEMPIYNKGDQKPSNDKRPAFNAWISKWKGWYMGFTHFVQLELEPDENTLWYLLGRRAAGICPRNQNGTDLLIPMFKKNSGDVRSNEMDESEVSLLLAQVKNKSPQDNSFSQSATKKISPRFVFGNKTRREPPTEEPDDNPLSNKPVHDIIRIYINHREEVKAQQQDRFRFIYASPLADNLPDIKKVSIRRAYRMVARIQRYRARVERHMQVGQELCEEVAKILASIVEPSWSPMARVDFDLQHRQNGKENNPSKAVLTETMPSDSLKFAAFKAFVNVPGREKKAAKTIDADKGNEGCNDAGKMHGESKKRQRQDDEDDQKGPGAKRSTMMLSATSTKQ